MLPPINLINDTQRIFSQKLGLLLHVPLNIKYFIGSLWVIKPVPLLCEYFDDISIGIIQWFSLDLTI